MSGIKIHHYALLDGDCFITLYQLFVPIFHKYITIVINVCYIFPIMLALCLMLSMTHYAQYYAGIIGGSLFETTTFYIEKSYQLSIVGFNLCYCLDCYEF